MASDAVGDHERSAEALGLTAIVLLAFAVRAFAWSQTAVVFNDGPIFLAMAEAIGEGHWAAVLAHPYHPLYPALVAVFGGLSIELETAAVGVSILGGMLSVAAVYCFVRDVFGRDIGWLAAWLMALHPWAVDFSADVMSDGLYTGVFLVGFAALAKAVDRPTTGHLVGAGLASGLAYLVRPEGIGLVVAGVFLMIARGVLEPTQRRRMARGCIVLSLAGAVVVVPFVVAVERVTGEFSLTQKKSIADLVAASDPAPSGTQRADQGVAVMGAPEALPLPEFAIRADGPGVRRPARDVAGFVEALGRVMTTSLAAFRFELLPFVLIGFWALRSNPRSLREWSVGLPIALYSGVLVLLVWGAGYVSRRHALPAWLPLLGYAALGWQWLCAQLTRQAPIGSWFGRLNTQRAIRGGLVVVLVLAWGARDLRPRRVDRAPVREAAEWLARNHPESGGVAAQKLRTAYYARARFVPLTSGTDMSLAADLRQRGARWVVIDAAKLEDHRGLKEGIGDWLRPVHRVRAEGRSALVLAVEGGPAG